MESICSFLNRKQKILCLLASERIRCWQTPPAPPAINVALASWENPARCGFSVSGCQTLQVFGVN